MFNEPVESSNMTNQIQKVSEILQQQSTKATSTRMVQKAELTEMLHERLTSLSAKTAELEGERSIHNLKSTAALDGLTSKFSLIQKIQQSLG